MRSILNLSESFCILKIKESRKVSGWICDSSLGMKMNEDEFSTVSWRFSSCFHTIPKFWLQNLIEQWSKCKKKKKKKDDFVSYNQGFCLGFTFALWGLPIWHLLHRPSWGNMTKNEFTLPCNFTYNLNFRHDVRYELEMPCRSRNSWWQKRKEPEGPGRFSWTQLLFCVFVC